MKRLWTPWRLPYLESPPSQEGCLFCQRLAEPDGPDNLILHRGPQAFVILNLYPYTNGHMMVVPNQHIPSLESLPAGVLTELMAHVQRALGILRSEYRAEAFNVGANIGEAAGAGIADHVHMHVLPRWPGDTNFMATTGETRVLPETLEQTYARLRRAWDRTDGWTS
jgi:ATP adenylyltransferase